MKWLEKLGGDKKERILILLLAGVLLLVIVIPTGQEGGEMTETGDSVQVVSDDTGRTKEEALEQRLAAVLAQVVGIGKVEVMITLKSNGRQIVEKDMEQQQDITDTETPAEAAVAGRRRYCKKMQRETKVRLYRRSKRPRSVVCSSWRREWTRRWRTRLQRRRWHYLELRRIKSK